MVVFKIRNTATGEFKDRKGFSAAGRVYATHKAAGCARSKTIYHNRRLEGLLTVDMFNLVEAAPVNAVTSDEPGV